MHRKEDPWTASSSSSLSSSFLLQEASWEETNRRRSRYTTSLHPASAQFNFLSQNMGYLWQSTWLLGQESNGNWKPSQNCLQHLATLSYIVSIIFKKSRDCVWEQIMETLYNIYHKVESSQEDPLFPIWVAKPLEVFGSSFKWSKWPFTLPCGIGKKLIAMLKNLLHWHGICLSKLVTAWLHEPCQER